MLGLQKIVLHNSYFKGKTVAIPCNGHTNNSGGNGAGKSSALNLIPIFYGEAPETVNDRAGGKLSFLDFYLPTSASLIAFEYLREDGPRCVAMYRHPSGKTAYRFVNADFQTSFFEVDLKDKLLDGFAITDAVNELKKRNIPVSRQITNISEYRCIIQQNDKSVRKAARSSKSIRAETKEYCLGGPKSQMIHMDRLTFSILKRNSMFKRLKKMVVDTMFGEINIEDKPNHDRNQFLVEEIRSVRSFSSNESKIKECVKQSLDRVAVQLNIGKYARNLKSLVQEQLDQISGKEKDQKALVDKFQKEEAEYSGQRQDIDDERQSIDSKRKAVSNRIEDIYKQKDEWDEKGIQKKISLHDDLEMYIDQSIAAKKHYESLLEKVSDIELERKASEAEIERSSQAETSNITEKISDLEKRKLSEEIGYKNEISEIQKSKNSELEESNEEYHLARDLLQHEKSQQSAILDNISETSEEKAKIEFAQNAMDNTQEKIDFLNIEVGDASQERSRVQSDLNKALDHLSNKKRQLERYYDACDAIKSRLYPDDHTLLSELRKQDSAWGETIGKILDPSLLQSKSLSPIFQENSVNHAFGWAFDLSKLPTPASAESEEVLKAKLEKEENNCSLCKNEISTLEESSKKITSDLKGYSNKVDKISFERDQKKDDLEALRLNRESIKNDIREAVVMERKQNVARKVKEVEGLISDLTKKHTLSLSGIKDRFSNLENDAFGRYSITISDIDLDIDSKRELMSEVESSRFNRLRQLEVVFSSKYQQEGVDESHVKEANQERKRLSQRVSNIERTADEIRMFKSWERQEWSGLKDLEVEEKELLSIFEKKCANLESLRSNFKRKKELHNKTVSLIERELKALRTSIEESKAILRSFGNITDGDSFESTDISFVRNKLTSLKEEESSLKSKILASINSARRIVTASPESQIAKAWSQLEEIRVRNSGIASHEQEFMLQQPVDLETLIEGNLPQIRKALVETVINIGGGINNYYLTLKQLTSQIKRVSSDLGNKINTDQKIDNLKDIKILLTSRIEEEECWVSLIRFSSEWEAWNFNRDDLLPPESLMAALKEALDTLSVARITNDIGSLVNLNLSMIENGRPVTIRSDGDFDRVSSNGLSYLAICVVFLGMSRYLCPDMSIKLTWPVDELAALSPKNISKLFKMLDSANIAMFSAFPSQDTNLLKFFEHKNLLDLDRGVRSIKINEKIDRESLKNQILDMAREEVV